MHEVTAHTDGSARGNPGPAGWAVLIEGELHSDWLPFATNNDAEMFAALQAVMLCPPRCKLTIVTDSKLVVGWLSKAWRMRNKHIVAIAGAFFDVMITKSVVVKFVLVKGHAGDPDNERVDRAARAQAQIAWNILHGRTDG